MAHRRKTRVLIADDHGILRDSIASLIGAQPDMEVVATAVDGHDAIAKARTTKPDIAVVDLSMPRGGGLEAIEEIRATDPRIAVLVLSMHTDESYLRATLGAGAAGYVAKQVGAAQLLNALREVRAGRIFVDVPGASFPRGVRADARDGARKATVTDRMSPREKETFVLLALGHTNREIGEKLGVSPKTIDTHRIRIMQKLGLTSRADVVRLALDLGVLKTEGNRREPPKTTNNRSPTGGGGA